MDVCYHGSDIDRRFVSNKEHVNMCKTQAIIWGLSGQRVGEELWVLTSRDGYLDFWTRYRQLDVSGHLGEFEAGMEQTFFLASRCLAEALYLRLVFCGTSNTDLDRLSSPNW